MTPVDSNGEVCFLSSSPVHVVADLDGWFGAASTAVDDVAVTDEDTAVVVDVLANDVRVDSIVSFTQPSSGTVAAAAGGLRYTPVANACNDGKPTDDFSYVASPGGTTATVAVSVRCVADPPVAVDDVATVLEDAGPTALALLANDVEVDGETLTIASVTQPPDGTVVIVDGGTRVTYEPDPDFSNDTASPEIFTYTIAPDGSTATVRVTVTGVEDDPIAGDDSFVSDADDPGGPADRNAIGNTRLNVGDPPSARPERRVAGSLLDNDSTPDPGQSHEVSAVQGAGGSSPFAAATDEGGSVTVDADGTFVYDPPVGFTGTDTFTYTLSDGDGPTDDATVSIEVADTVWYVDSSSPGAVGTGAGTGSDPFVDLTNLDAGGSTGDADDPGDVLFVYQGSSNGFNSGAYTGPLPLEPGQRLIGEPTGLTVDGTELVPPDSSFGTDGQYPEIRSTTFGVVLDDDVSVSGVATRNTTGTGWRGDEIGGVTLDRIAHFGGGQRALHLSRLDGPLTSTGGLSVLGEVSNAPSVDAVLIEDTMVAGTVVIEDLVIRNADAAGLTLDGNAGAVTIQGGEIDENEGYGVRVLGGAAPVTVDTGIGRFATNGGSVRVLDRTGGPVGFGGDIVDNSGSDLFVGGTTSTGSNVGTVTFGGDVTLQTLINS
ncbi:MAG: Ig-like domain-containing protein, partial [Actinomycetota bacterium]